MHIKSAISSVPQFRRWLSVGAGLAAFSVFGCLPTSPPQDAGVVDAGAPDAGVVDAGAVDAGLVDAGVDAGVLDAGRDAGPQLDCFAPSFGVCEDSALTQRWRAFQGDAENFACDVNADCAFLLPEQFYTCGCDDGSAIWSKDGLAVGVDAVAEAEAINSRYLAPECADYRRFCGDQVCDGYVPVGSECVDGRCGTRGPGSCESICGVNCSDGG